MKTVAYMVVIAGVASGAAAQESIRYDWGFVEVTAGTNTPVPSPDGVIEPGEGARLVLTTTITPGIGSPATYAPPPGPGVGTIAGLGSVFFDLIGSGETTGVWSSLVRLPGWSLGVSGSPTPDGSSILACQAGQFVLPGQTVSAANPIPSLWHGVWTPTSYSPRTVTFQSHAAAAAGGNHSAILINYGLDPDNNPLYVGRFVGGEFGSAQIPIVPEPAVLVPGALLLAALGIPRRRRGAEP